MDESKEAFTRQILRCVSARRQHDKSLDVDALRTRFKNLKSIEDASMSYASSISVTNDNEYNDRSNDTFNLTGITYSRNDDNNNEEKSTNPNGKFSDHFLTFNDANDEEEKLTNGHIKVPAKSIAQLRQKAKTPSKTIIDSNQSQSSISDIAPSTELRTKNPEKRTNTYTTEAVVKMCQRVSSILTDIRCDLAEAQLLNDKKCVTMTEISSRSFIKDISDGPIMESTRKSAINSAKISSVTNETTGKRFLAGSLDEDRTLRANFSKSGTLSNIATLYRSMRLGRSRSIRSVRLEREESKAIIPSRFKEVDKIQKLLREISIQRTLMNQATKALHLCNSLKQLTERVESERILLLASLRGDAALEEIKWITCKDTIEDSKTLSSPEEGEVTISEISLDLQECLARKIQEERLFDEYFVVVVTQGLKVWSTRPISCVVGDKRINFPSSISIPNLTPGFKIRIEVYSLKLITSHSNEEKSRSRRTSFFKNIFVSPRRFFKKISNGSDSPSVHRCNSGYVETSDTSFVRCGYTELILEDLSISSPWPLMLVPNNSKLRGTIDLNLACRLHFSSSHEGFLNYGDESGGLATWNRRWCVLRGHTLNFWNYPRDQENKEPLKIIQLVNCVSTKVTIVDRTICAKPRTLLIETRRAKCPNDRNSILLECKPECTIVRNLLSYDTSRELNEWSQKLNEVIAALEEWKVIRSSTNLSNSFVL